MDDAGAGEDGFDFGQFDGVEGARGEGGEAHKAEGEIGARKSVVGAVDADEGGYVLDHGVHGMSAPARPMVCSRGEHLELGRRP